LEFNYFNLAILFATNTNSNLKKQTSILIARQI